MAPTHGCSKPECLPAQSDLDRGSLSFKHRAKLMCSLLLKDSASPHCVEAQAACTCCSASALPPPLPSPAPRSLPSSCNAQRLAFAGPPWLPGVKCLVSCHFRFYSFPPFPNKTTTYLGFQLTGLRALSFVVWDACLLTMKERMIPAVFHIPQGKPAKPARKR